MAAVNSIHFFPMGNAESPNIDQSSGFDNNGDEVFGIPFVVNTTDTFTANGVKTLYSVSASSYKFCNFQVLGIRSDSLNTTYASELYKGINSWISTSNGAPQVGPSNPTPAVDKFTTTGNSSVIWDSSLMGTSSNFSTYGPRIVNNNYQFRAYIFASTLSPTTIKTLLYFA